MNAGSAANRKGNALFLILIAVALFAALSYAVTQSGRGSGSVSREQTSLAVSQLMQVASLIQATVNRMIIMGADADDIKFTALSCNNGDPDENCCVPVGVAEECTTGENCVFAPEGGGLTPPSVPVSVLGNPASYTAGGVWFCYYPTSSERNDAGGPGTDITFAVDGLTEAACVAINKAAGISGIPAHSPPHQEDGPLCVTWAANEYSMLHFIMVR